MKAPDVQGLCAEFDIEIVPGNVYPKPGQTRVLATIRQIMSKYGAGHIRIVLSTLSETTGKEGLIDQFSLWATSDLVLACSDWIESDLSGWYEAWDQLPMGYTMWECNQLSGYVPQRHALAGTLFMMLSMYKDAQKASRAPNYKMLMKAFNSENSRRGAISMGVEWVTA